MKSKIIIIGGGAAGLMAAAAAAERGLRPLLIERKHRPGRKILLCGNNRCNLSSRMPVDDMIKAYGEPVGEFLRNALNAFSTEALIRWFKANNLPVSVHGDGRVFPSSEKADDVLHVFTDLLRDCVVPVLYNCPVTGIRRNDNGLVVETESIELETENVLLATGGVSYPKTGSVGDGQKFAGKLGHKVLPYRPGLAGFVVGESWLNEYNGVSFMDTLTRVMVGDREVALTCGEILCNKWGLSGPAMVNASRIIARRNIRNYHFVVDLKPDLDEKAVVDLLVKRINKRGGKCSLQEVLSNAFVPAALCRDYTVRVLGSSVTAKISSTDLRQVHKIADAIKNWKINPVSVRPLKEAMVTVGGIALGEINPATMESLKCPGLYFAGEVMDVDGPTGGFNLHAAFATGRLAINSLRVNAGQPARKPAVHKPRKSSRHRKPRRPSRR